jgi:hypothetical protein
MPVMRKTAKAMVLICSPFASGVMEWPADGGKLTSE